MKHERAHDVSGEVESASIRRMSPSGIESATAPAFIAWPGWKHLGFATLVGLGWTLAFYVLYGGASFITGLHQYRLRVDFSFEQNIPFVPAMALAYIFLIPALQLSPFIIRERAAYLRFARLLVYELMAAAVIFVILPVGNSFPKPDPSGLFKTVFQLADYLNLEHNHVPSMHVAFAVTVGQVYSTYVRGMVGKAIIGCFSALIVVATVLTHQHHLVDVVAGCVLAWVACLLARGRAITKETLNE